MPGRLRNKNGGSNKLAPATSHSQLNRKINILMWLLRDLAALNVKLLVDFSGVIRSKMQSKEPIQLNEHSVDPRKRCMGTVGQLRDMLVFIF